MAEENWPLLQALGHVICLTASEEEILRRVGDSHDRPLLSGTPAEIRERIHVLLARRQPAYARADWTLPTDGVSPEQLAERIAAWYSERETRSH
jgi:shikimate kinase